MKILKFFTCVLLVVSLMATAVMPLAAARATYYLSDLKMAEADTEEEAKALLTGAGYTVIDKNLNPGGGKAVYLGYKKSTNVDDAITDVRVMNMGGGFNISSYDAIRNDAIVEYGPTIDRIRIAANEFAENYKAGKREALLAYRQLNYYYVEVNKVKTKMGDYMLNFPEKNEDFADILLKGNPTILNNIRSLLTMGVSDGGALIERIKAAVNDETVYGKKQYFEDAKVLASKAIQLKKLKDETVDRISEIMSDPNMSEEDKEMCLVMPRYTYTLVTAFEAVMSDINTKGGENYRDYFNRSVITDYTVLYPFIDAMTPGQRAMAVSGQLHSVLVYNCVEMSDEEIEEKLAKTEETLEEMSVYFGTNMDLVNGSIGVTSDALREEAATGNHWLSSFTGNKAADLTIASLFGAGGLALIIVSARYLSSQMDNGYVSQIINNSYLYKDGGSSALSNSGAYSSQIAKDAQSTSSVGASEVSGVGIGFATAGVFIGAVMMILSIRSIVEIINKYKVEYSDIPVNMVDVVSTINGNRYVSYKVVNSIYKNGEKNAERPGDTNCYDGDQWNAIFYTKSHEAGKCMTANAYIIDSASNFGKYTPVAKFGTKTCYDLNTFNGNKSKDTIFIAFGNSNNKKSTETSIPTVVGSVISYGALAIAGAVGLAVGMGAMTLIKRKKEKNVKA